jgi:hypothetical protein
MPKPRRKTSKNVVGGRKRPVSASKTRTGVMKKSDRKFFDKTPGDKTRYWVKPYANVNKKSAARKATATGAGRKSGNTRKKY